MAPLEPWIKVFITDDYFGNVELGIEGDPHGQLKCTQCHGGNSSKSDKHDAHESVVAHPSENKETCLGCHSDDAIGAVLNNFDSSLHKTQEGYFERFKIRAGFDMRDDGHEELLHEFDMECGQCHASCGQCHISRPISVGSGFREGHRFKATPDQTNNCIACHGSRIGAEFLGDNGNAELTDDPYEDFDGNRVTGDVHRFQFPSMRCEHCHEGHEMHGNGTKLTYRYDERNTDMPMCEDCHADVSTANLYHNMHWSGSSTPTLSCQVCHSQTRW